MTENKGGSGTKGRKSSMFNTEAGEWTVSPRSELLNRTSQTRNKLTALTDVHQRLAAATELYESYPDAGRLGTVIAISAVLDYFVSIGLPHATLQPLINVTVALTEAKNGIHNPTFEVQRTGNRGQRKSLSDRMQEGLLAGVTECCVVHFRKEGRAFLIPAGRLAEKMVRESSFVMASYPSAKKLMKLREQVTAMESGSVERQAYDRVISIADRGDPLAHARVILLMPWGRAA